MPLFVADTLGTVRSRSKISGYAPAKEEDVHERDSDSTLEFDAIRAILMSSVMGFQLSG